MALQKVEGDIRRSPCGSVDRNAEKIAAMLLFREVAPRAGAWIETGVARGGLRGSNSSLPVRERGSKQRPLHSHLHSAASRSPCGSVDRNWLSWSKSCAMARRSPCGSVDRNPAVTQNLGRDIKSLPVRERGSKRLRYRIQQGPAKSLPVRERGSKPQEQNHIGCGLLVAPRAGAWIETL